MGLCVFDVYEKYYNSKTGGMSNIMGKNPYPLSPQGVNCSHAQQNVIKKILSCFLVYNT